MDSTVLVALIAFAGSALGTVCGVLINGKLVNYRLEQLEKKQDVHNNLIERTYKLESKVKVLEVRVEKDEEELSKLENTSS